MLSPVTDVDGQPGTVRRYLPLLLPAVAIGMQLAVAVVYLIGALLMPGWATGLLAFWWVLLDLVLGVLAARRSALVLIVPVLAAASWVAAYAAGRAWLGWH